MAKKIILNNETIIDLSTTTARAEDVAAGKVFFTSEGTPGIGTDENQTLEAVDLSITQNGNYTAEDGKSWSFVSANVVPVLQSKVVKPLETLQVVQPEIGYEGLSQVSIDPIETEEITVNNNGVVTPTTGKYFSKVTVNVAPEAQQEVPLQEKTIVIRENTTISLTPDNGYTGLSQATAIIDIPAAATVYRVVTPEDLPEDAPLGSLALVWRGGNE